MFVRAGRNLAFACLALLTFGCTNIRRLDPPTVIRPDGGIGRNKIVGATLKDGREIRFDINSSTYVSRDTLRGSASRQPTRIPVSDLQQVWVEFTNVKRTTVTVVVVGALLVGFVALAVSQMEFGL